MNLELLGIIFSITVYISCLVVEFIYIMRTDRFGRGILLGWGLLIFGALLNCSILPWIVSTSNPEYVKYFPNPIVFSSMTVAGWVPALTIAGIAIFVQGIIEWLHSSKPKEYLKNKKPLITLVFAALLCIFIFIPYINACFMFVLRRISPGLIPFSIYILIDDIINIAAWAVSGSLMALLIGFVLKNNQVISTLKASLIVTIVYIFLRFPTYFTSLIFFQRENNAQLLLMIVAVLQIVFFWACAYGFAWLMEYKFCKSLKSMDPV